MKVAVLSDSVAVMLEMDTTGSSSSVMTKSPVLLVKEPLDALLKVRVAVSVTSSVLSSVIGTVMVAVVSPAVMVAVPEVAVKSVPLCAPLDAPVLKAYSTVVSVVTDSDKVMVKLAVPSPSATV